MRFGRQRPASDVAALALLFAGFSLVAAAIFHLRGTFFGALLPLTFIAGTFVGLRSEVREVELRDDTLVLRTFFRGYNLPRQHVVAVVMTPQGVAVDVLNGARYAINPRAVDPPELERALRQWLAAAPR